MIEKKTLRWVAIVVLVAFVAWVLYTTFSRRVDAPVTNENVGDAADFSPRFQKEGELFFLNPETKDTIKKIDIELAERRDEIEYGMMYRKTMDINTGMLFLMESLKQQSFYMKNTYVSLDMIFINEKGIIVSIQEKTEPLNTRSLFSEGPADKVLEVKGGFSEKFGIGKGMEIVWNRN